MFICIFFKIKTSAVRQKSDQVSVTCKVSEKHSTADRAQPSDHSLLASDHSYAVMDSPRKLKRKIDDLNDKLNACRKKLKCEHQKSERLKKKVSDLSSVVETLKKERIVSTNCADMLETTISCVPQEIMKRVLKTKNLCKYSKELKAFAMTLHFYSAKAYQYVRENFDLALPNPRTIRSWYSRIDAEPGFTKVAFDSLQARAQDRKEKGQETVCALMVDEMAIRRHVEYAGGKFQGYVDIGSGIVDDSLPVAKDAMVLMVVAINESWKLPLGYFLIDGMSGEERANIINDCLHRLHDSGVHTISLTCDGPSCNFSMMRALGATMSVQGMNPSFPHPADPSQTVNVVLDVCHMVKLLRNAFADGGVFQTGDGKKIRWQYIEELNKLQEEEGLRLGNKLRMAHIEWRKQKMKVNLATQVFSRSVADALEYCNKELNLPQFEGCEETVEFIRKIDGAFDVLNSRNPLGKGLKAPMKTTNQERTKNILQSAEEYLLGLKDGGGTPMHCGPRRTAIIGFIASSRSISKIFEELVLAPNARCRYLLTYKLSQDHLELFFSAIRSCGGFNNNPTVRQFKSAYKRLLMRHEIKNGTGNCIIRDNTTILEATPTATNIARRFNLLPREPEKTDHDYADCPNVEVISEYKEAAINYIAGFVARKIKEKNTCMPCTMAVTSAATVHPFVAMKDRGGLEKPSPGIVAVCKATERCFQQLLKISGGKLPQGFGVTPSVVRDVLSDCVDRNLFPELHNHMFDTSVEENHLHLLVKVAASWYCKIRMHHLGKRETEKVTGTVIRKKLTKMVLFHHQ